MQKPALPFIACLLALAVAGAHAQTLWKWRDASGQMHIGDTPPPPGTPAKDIIGRPMGSVAPRLTAASASAQPAGPAASTESALEKRKKAADLDKANKEKADHDAVTAKNEAIRKDNCGHAQSEASALQSGVRMATINANGEREVMDDTARAEALKRTQAIVAANCGPAPAGQ